jgi:hypothetical protein
LHAELLPGPEGLLDYLQATRFTADMRGDGEVILEGGETATVVTGDGVATNPAGAPLRFDLSLGARGVGSPVGPPSDSLQIVVSRDLVAHDPAVALGPLFRRAVEVFRPYFAYIRLWGVSGPFSREMGLYAAPSVGWMTYLESNEYPAVPQPLEGMSITDFAGGTLMELTARPWDPDNRRVTSLIVAAYDALEREGVMIPPKHVREVIWAVRDGDEDDDEPDEEDDDGEWEDE